MLSVDWREQEELINSFINVEEYDKLLFLLESRLFSIAPRLLCPSAFVLKVILTLCTLSDYYNADLMRSEFRDKPSSEIPLSNRAYQLLYTLIIIVRDHEYGIKTDSNNNPFGKVRYNDDDIIFAKTQLIESLSFIDDSSNLYDLRKTNSKRNYREKPVSPLKMTPKKNRVSLLNFEDNEKKWSPERRKLEMEFAIDQERREMNNENESSDSETEFHVIKTADKKSSKILKNDRIDIALYQNKIWIAIQWCLKCSFNTVDPIIYKSWQMWDKVISLIVEILKIEFNSFIKEQKNDDKLLFQDLITYKFLAHTGQYSWNIKFPETLLKTKKFSTSPIFSNELTKAKSIVLERVLQEPDRSMLISKKGSKLIRDLFLIGCRSTKYRKYDRGSSERIIWNFDKLLLNFSTLLLDAKYDDLVNLIRIDDEYMNDSLVVKVYENILTFHLVQLNTYVFDQPNDEEWIYDKESSNFILDLFEKVEFTEKLFILNNVYDSEKVLDDYNKVSLTLYMILKLWIHCTKEELDSKKMKQFLIAAEVGEKERLKIVKAIFKKAQKHLEFDDLKDLTTFIKYEINQL